MLIFGVLAMLVPAGVAAFVGWENRDVIVQLQVADHVWTGHLYAVLVLGALMACWFLLGASCIHVRVRERRLRPGAERSAAASPAEPSAAPPAGADTARPAIRERPDRRRGRIRAVGVPH